MRSQKLRGLLIGVRLAVAAVAAVAFVASPRGYGGGGDEGVDILPYHGGEDGAGLAGGGGGSKPALGYVAVDPRGDVTMTDGADWRTAGLLTGPHRVTDVMRVRRGREPWRNRTSLEVTVKKAGGKGQKGKRFLDYGGTAALVHLDGRFAVEDIDPTDIESLQLVGQYGMPAIVTVVVGQRGTQEGGIYASFTRIDQIVTQDAPTGVVDLKAARAEAIQDLQGTGVDVAIGIVTVTATGIVESWAAFNVDDQAALYDIEN